MKKQVYSEKYLERKLVAQIKGLKGECIKLLSTHLTGLPDRLCLLPEGVVVFAEIKTTGEKPRRIQEVIHNRLRSLGFRVYIVDTDEALQKLIQDVKREQST